MTQMLSRLLVSIFLANGLITVVWGRSFLRWQRRLALRWYRPALDALLGWPELLLRLGAAGEAVLGGVWLWFLTDKEQEKR